MNIPTQSESLSVMRGLLIIAFRCMNLRSVNSINFRLAAYRVIQHTFPGKRCVKCVKVCKIGRCVIYQGVFFTKSCVKLHAFVYEKMCKNKGV